MQLEFSFEEGDRRKEQGLERAGLSRGDLLEVARLLAIKIARVSGQVTSDDVYRLLEIEGYNPGLLGPAAGALFRNDFEFTGRWAKSARVSNHARVNRVWRLKAAFPQEATSPQRPLRCA